MTLTEFLIYGAATWRIASLLVQENGPFHIFRWMRERFGIIHDDEDNVVGIPHTFFGELLSCVWCSSIWVAIFLGIVILVIPSWSLKIAMVFAFSTIAVMIEKWLPS